MDTAGEHFKQGKDYYYNNEFEDAAIEFEHAIRLDRQNEDYFYWCGLAYYENDIANNVVFDTLFACQIYSLEYYKNNRLLYFYL